VKRITVSPQAYRRVIAFTWFMQGASFGMVLTSFLLEKQRKAFNDKITKRHTLIVDAYDQIQKIGHDVTLSGEEREKKMNEIVDFIRVISSQDLM